MSSTSPPYIAITHQPHEDPIRHVLNSTDLLIRAISMILFLLWPEAELSRPRSDSSYQRLDRLSLLFVSGGGADVAAISAVIHKDGVVVEAVQECNDPVIGQLEVWKNHDKREVSSASDPALLKQALLEDPIRFCVERGVGAISPYAHGEVLERILTTMYETRSPPIQECPELQLLNRYIYCFCIEKIRKCLNASIPGYSRTYLSLFLDKKGLGLITRELFQSRDTARQRRPSAAKVPDETWLYEALMMTHAGVDFGVAPDGTGSYQMRIDEERAWYIWDLFATSLKALDDLSGRVESLVKGRKEKAFSANGSVNNEGHLSEKTSLDADLYALVHATLDAIAERMTLLYCFAHESGSFWQLVTSMSGVLNSRQGDPRSSPTSPRRDASPARHVLNADATYFNLPPQANLVGAPPLGIRKPSEAPQVDPNEQSQEDEETSDSDDGDDLVDNPYRLSDVALRIRSWLRRLTQWHAALYDLSQGHLAAGILNKKVTIKVEIAPRPVEPTKQASLRSAVEAVVGKDRLEDSLGLILSRARQKWSDPDRPPTWPAGKTLLTASLLDESSMNSWEDQFFSSSIHCEACLACGMPESLASEQVKGKLLGALKDKLENALNKYAASHRNGDSSPGSDHGSAAPKHIHVKFTNPTDILSKWNESFQR
ncbi:hypothetical protein FRC04_007451 [Tulasnella sp. 424]|nr:hypothetical protein FRC04_007451 [Tulasnella sp. 424]KAG8975145.1 hypothetical protein FRC05_006313 [Tulasnella sp. 425]